MPPGTAPAAARIRGKKLAWAWGTPKVRGHAAISKVLLAILLPRLPLTQLATKT